ncbi:pentapeptide repeat-containing protein [Streptomyces sp. NPDC002308]
MQRATAASTYEAAESAAAARARDVAAAFGRGVAVCGADVCGADACGADARGADARGADARGADARGADARGADALAVRGAGVTAGARTERR